MNTLLKAIESALRVRCHLRRCCWGAERTVTARGGETRECAATLYNGDVSGWRRRRLRAVILSVCVRVSDTLYPLSFHFFFFKQKRPGPGHREPFGSPIHSKNQPNRDGNVFFLVNLINYLLNKYLSYKHLLIRYLFN